MAVLSDAKRIECWAEYQRDPTMKGEELSIDKAALRAAVDSTDAWVNDNSVSFNNSLPAAAKSSLTERQKARPLVWVLRKRFTEGS